MNHPGQAGADQRRVVASTLSNFVGKFVTLGLWFFLTPFLVRQLGPSAYGLWILVSSVIGYAALLDLGITPAVTKYVAEYHARDQLDDARSLVATALWLYVALGLVAILASAFLAPLFPRFFDVPLDQHSTASWMVLLAGVALGVSLPCATTSAVLQGLQRFDLVNLVSIIGMSLYAIATVAVILLGGGVLGLIAINIPLTLFMQIPAIWLIHRAAPGLRYGFGRPRLVLARKVFTFSSTLVVINLAHQVQTQSDEIVIGAFSPVANVTPYAIARRLSGLPHTLSQQFIKVLMPLASRLNATADQGTLRSLYLTSSRLSLALGVPLVIALIILGRPLLTVWVGPDYAFAAPLLSILALATLFEINLSPATQILQGMGRHRPIAGFTIAAALANLGLSIALIQPLGLMGVALGTLIPTALNSILLVTPYAMRQSGATVRAFIEEVLAPCLFPALAAVGVLASLREVVQPNSYMMIGLVGLAGMGVYGLLYLLLTRGKPEQLLAQQLAAHAVASARARSRLFGRAHNKDAP